MSEINTLASAEAGPVAAEAAPETTFADLGLAPELLRALILALTRELALQVFESVKAYSKHTPIRSMCAFGGVDIKPQIAEMKKGVEILVATPGRLLDHVESKSVSFNSVQALVLDEADRMLDMGFIPDVTRILKMLPAD